MITYFREMPDSPDLKLSSHSTLSPKALNMTGMPPASRPLSANSSISGVNGSHSPQSTLNGRTPSPPTLGSIMNSSSGQQLPPACGARQLSKLKRFLTTLQQFGSDISPDIGECVRTLVLGLVNSHLSIEEFHAKLQEATNFPLRPFVIPFLKANLPLLQRELLHCARMAKQSPQQFLTQNEHIVFDPTHSPLESHESVLSEISESRKRHSSESRPKENGLELHLESPHPAKRHHGNHPISPVSSSRVSPGSAFNLSTGGPIRLEDISKSREMRERERLEREQVERERTERDRDRERHFSSYNFRSSESFDHLERFDDDWRHVETMLNCIIGMVDKTKRAMSVLQERSIRDREELSIWARRQADGIDADVKKRTGDVMAFTLRQTEDRVSEVRRRAEEAVNDVKRQAMLELQKAVSAADQKAADLVAAERVKMERTISEARKLAHADILGSLGHQEESAESCWNCGRKASETCSGCNVARYCGSFCQHKDWENHHHVCGKAHITSAAEAREVRRAAIAATAASTMLTSTAAVPTTSSLLPGGKDSTTAASSKGSASSDSVTITCVSPTPSVVPSLSVKDSAMTTTAPTTTTLMSSPTSSSPKSSSSVSSSPETSVQNSESTAVASSATESSIA